jgi:hypothetical protein
MIPSSSGRIEDISFLDPSSDPQDENSVEPDKTPIIRKKSLLFMH